MGVLDEYKAYWLRVFDFRGRSLRGECWWPVLLNGVMAIILEQIFPGLGKAVVFLTILPNVSVGFRRLHDTDRTAWWMLIGFVPVVGFLALLFFMASKGTVGDNRFGPRPV